MNPDELIYVAGHLGLVGSALIRRLQAAGCRNLVVREHADLDLTQQGQTADFFEQVRPRYVFLAAARVGGILANDSFPAQFLRDNLAIQTNVIDAAWRNGVQKLLFLGSSCVYPKHAPQPMREDCLLSGPLEPTNEWYAIAKIAGIKMCQAYRRQYGFNAIAVMPTNLYGPGDNFSVHDSHVLPAMIRKFHEAKLRGDAVVEIWGSGAPRREFLHVDDLADACLHMMQHYDDAQLVNIGWGRDITIIELAHTVARIVGFSGEVRCDRSKPDGTPRKLLDTTRLTALGWTPRIALEDGIRSTYAWYLENGAALRS